MTKETTIYSSI